MSTIDIAGLTMHGTRQVPELGALHFSNLLDWYSGAESKSPLREIPEGDGVFEIDREWRSGLPIAIEGWCHAANWLETLTIIRAMRRALIPKTMVEMSVTDALGIGGRKVSVRRLTIREDELAAMFTFAVDVFATDATLYGASVAVSTGLPTFGGGLPLPIVYPLDLGTAGDPGRVVVSNPGAADAFTDFEVAGGTIQGGFDVVNLATGRKLRYARPVLAGQTVYLDSRTTQVYVDSPENDMSGALTIREWWADAPESSYEVQFRALGPITGTPILTARTRPGY